MGLLDGKVAVITGSGGGIGRAHALAFAREGASVVVNDLGTDPEGEGSDAKLADRVVAEIEEAGGEAVPSYDSVATMEGAEAIVQAALDEWGRVDVLVNNAGILRDKTLVKMTEEKWDPVIAVHLKGTFACTKFAAAWMKEHGDGGRIINTTSYAGLQGNFGQSNYAAAKAGIYGLTQVWAKELAKDGITVNALAPMAKTRMTEDIDAVPEDMRPEHVAPVAVFLASDLARDVNGRVFGVHGQQVFEYKMKMTEGVEKPDDEGLWTPSEIDDRLDDIGREEEPAPAAPAGGAPRELTIADEIGVVFDTIDEFFRADKAGSEEYVYHFDVQDAGSWGVAVRGGTCTVTEGKPDGATCTVRVDADTMLGMAEGRVRGDQAFMQGKIKADNLPHLMKFGSIFKFDPDRMQAALEEAKGGGAPAGTATAAEPAELTEEAMVGAVFRQLPEVFKSSKAAGWKSVVAFHIGDQDWAVRVLDGTCTVEEGDPDDATANVTASLDVFTRILEGDLKAQQAFMQGKLKVDKIPDMMKFAKCIDLREARKQAEKAHAASGGGGGGGAAPATAEPTDEEMVELVFERLPEVFKSEKAAGWDARIHFEVGDLDLHVLVEDQECTTGTGAPDDPTSTMKVALDDFLAMVQGDLKPQVAFMQGKFKVDNMNDAMKFGAALDLKKAREKVDAALAEGGAGAAAPQAGQEAPAPEPLDGPNPAFVGRTFKAGAIFAKPEHIKAYARATNDPNPWYLDEDREGGIVAPPLFTVRHLHQVVADILTHPESGVDMLRLVHGEQDMTFHRPVRPWDLLAVRGEMTDIEEKGSGHLVTVEGRVWSGGRRMVDARSTYFIKKEDDEGGEAPAGKKETKGKKKGEVPEGEPLFTSEMEVTKDQSIRYGEASTDKNPIHIDPQVAKAAGLPDIILQGLCTMAFTSRAVVQEALDGDPLGLERLAVRFSAPVFMGDVLTTEAWETETDDEGRELAFRTVNEDGEPVIVNGVAELTADDG